MRPKGRKAGRQVHPEAPEGNISAFLIFRFVFCFGILCFAFDLRGGDGRMGGRSKEEGGREGWREGNIRSCQEGSKNQVCVTWVLLDCLFEMRVYET